MRRSSGRKRVNLKARYQRYKPGSKAKSEVSPAQAVGTGDESPFGSPGSESFFSSLPFDDAPFYPDQPSPTAMASNSFEGIPDIIRQDGDARERAGSSNLSDMDGAPRAGAPQQSDGFGTQGSNEAPHRTPSVEEGLVVDQPALAVDVADRIPGLYRILDLVSEQSSGGGGLVDKIIISQDSFGRFANDVCLGAYQSMTNVDFGLLDTAHLKPLGIYGSRSEIVRYLQDMSFVDDEMSLILLGGTDDMPASQALRAGMYLLRSPKSELVQVIFWPQDSTWEDDAVSSVQRNRVTFMRYLTKIADQIIVLMAEEHANAIVWSDEETADTLDVIEGEVDRLFTFEVAKTKEEQENVVSRPGFEVANLDIDEIIVPEDPAVTPDVLAPRLVPGETGLGFMTVTHEAARDVERSKNQEYYRISLNSFIKRDSFRLSGSLSEDALDILVKNGLDRIVSEELAAFRTERSAIESRRQQESKGIIERLNQEIRTQHPLLLEALRYETARAVASKYEVFAHETFVDTNPDTDVSTVPPIDINEARELLNNLEVMHPDLRKRHQFIDDEGKFTASVGSAFKEKMEQLLLAQPSLVDLIYKSPLFLPDQPSSDPAPQGSTFAQVTKRGVTAAAKAAVSMLIKPTSPSTTGTHSRAISDTNFLRLIPTIIDSRPDLVEEITEVVNAARRHFISQMSLVIPKAAGKIENTRRLAYKAQLDAIEARNREVENDRTRSSFLRAVEFHFQRNKKRHVVVEDVTQKRHKGHDVYTVVGTEHTEGSATLRHSIRTLQLTTNDMHSMQLDSTHLPNPLPSPIFTFAIPIHHRVAYIQLIQGDLCLLVIENEGNHMVYLDRFHELELALRHTRHKKLFSADKLGGKLVLAYEESKRMLAVCAIEKLQVHVFVFGERYESLHGLGAVHDLTAWYDHEAVITHLAFRCGPHEELLVIDQQNGPRARILSLTSQSFRPASLSLRNNPRLVLSSPDGSCFFTADAQGGATLQAYHWDSFGSTQGVTVNLPNMPADSLSICSLVSRSQVYIVALDYASRRICSAGLQITHKSTEFTFKADQLQGKHRGVARTTTHNSLVDTLRDVWVRFPVVPAVRRHTFKSSHRLPRSLTFISGIPSSVISRYYSELVLAFEKSTRKPTEGELGDTIISGVTYKTFMKERQNDLSTFKAGEWLVDMLCLIPIHIAVARDNRFVPLRDGVSTVDFERALLGATVEEVVDRLSFGWYESIFQSYMASKPVQVVSSMGEQSVGKSFALNHLVDTSFAGSAMRTTEGVWMSVTPTDDTLIVALDFEGVHSIERSAQEDSLLVLFNTAISNLVLFRNNFAFSRDISGLFQSFQSSAMILDPAANPSLFKSLLVIIIKDVVDSDKNEITKEFSLKFQQIVANEQEDNFISRLHGGKLAIIPWPVIESRQFYTLFQAVKKRLDMQPITHGKAGIFLQTMKTLMAKLKTNDWGSLDQNLATHRAQLLQAILPNALQFGVSEIDPEMEPLKDIDNGIQLEAPDALFEFCLPSADDMDGGDACLKTLQSSWSRSTERHYVDHELWTNDLGEYLACLADERIDYVRQWIDINTARFSGDTMTFEGLRREFESLIVALKSTIQLCKLQCAECQLLCLKARHHQGSHGCNTNHRCVHVCKFLDDHQEMEADCGLPAGHPGEHICDFSVHLCGQPCHLAGKAGCLEQCSKIVNHEDSEHICPAPLHECGMPCSLVDIRLADGSTYSCPEKCHASSEQPHAVHACKQQSCPLSCQLCGRLCSESLHLHGMDKDAKHLCGQEHICKALCQSRGICKIETAPQSVEVTFSGRHDTFQYTKYSQESRRLPCVAIIPPGETEHAGHHAHALDPKIFHYCETRCQNCGYFCTLPLDHAQQEHETSHGSMSQTKWAVEDADTSVIEVNGRRFGANDDGAPLLCSMLCSELGRHVHVDYCRTQPGEVCRGSSHEHIDTRMLPQPTRDKDFISHELYWRRTGFKDPYPHEEREEFSKCDRMCSGREHREDATTAAQPSFCTLPIFHPVLGRGDPVPGGAGYVSGDGHHFSCRNPARAQQAFHVIFVIDKSGSMRKGDRQPPTDTPVIARLTQFHNNRLGAVYSALYMFWNARQAATNGAGNRRDAYSVLLHDTNIYRAVNNDLTSSPGDLLNRLLQYRPALGNNFDKALKATQACMEANWSAERAPVIIFLSDGQCPMKDSVMRGLCRSAIARGRPASFHTVSFGLGNDVLRGMASIAQEVQQSVPADPARPVPPSSYVEALDSIRLAETFLGIADSLAKPRGALMHA